MPQPKSSGSSRPRSSGSASGAAKRSTSSGKSAAKASSSRAKPAAAKSAAAKPAAAKSAAAKPAAAKSSGATAKKKTGAAASKRTPAKTSTARGTAKRSPAKPAAKASGASATAAGAKPSRASASTGGAEDLRARLGEVRERLLGSVTIPASRLQEAVDEAVRRGRMTRGDAEDLVSNLLSVGRSQTEAVLADIEQLLGRGRQTASRSGDRVLRQVDRARRAAGIGGFPIMGFDDLTAGQIVDRLGELTPAQLRKVRDYERRNANRKSVLQAIEKRLA